MIRARNYFRAWVLTVSKIARSLPLGFTVLGKTSK